MDIAKYIGLYLLKNNYCYIHGLGNLELKKRPASYDGQALQGPAYEVRLTPTGSIDDSLANFIATNEQISISKAANALREFSTEAKADLQAGKEVVIPSLGKFTEQGGKIHFVTDPHLQYTPKAVLTVRHAATQNEGKAALHTPTYTNEPSTGGTINWGKIAVMALVVGLIVGAIAGVVYLNNSNKEEEVTEAPAPAVAEPVAQPVVADTTTADTMAVTNANTIASANGMLNFKVILNEYKSNATAEKRASKLKSFGYEGVEVSTKDSATYYVLLPISAAAADTAHVLDSLKRNLNPKGVSIYR